jgi:hypothetical protein
MGEHHSFRFSGGSGCVNQGGDIIGFTQIDFRIDGFGFAFTGLEHGIESHHLERAGFGR